MRTFAGSCVLPSIRITLRMRSRSSAVSARSWRSRLVVVHRDRPPRLIVIEVAEQERDVRALGFFFQRAFRLDSARSRLPSLISWTAPWTVERELRLHRGRRRRLGLLGVLGRRRPRPRAWPRSLWPGSRSRSLFGAGSRTRRRRARDRAGPRPRRSTSALHDHRSACRSRAATDVVLTHAASPLPLRRRCLARRLRIRGAGVERPSLGGSPPSSALVAMDEIPGHRRGAAERALIEPSQRRLFRGSSDLDVRRVRPRRALSRDAVGRTVAPAPRSAAASAARRVGSDSRGSPCRGSRRRSLLRAPSHSGSDPPAPSPSPCRSAPGDRAATRAVDHAIGEPRDRCGAMHPSSCSVSLAWNGRSPTTISNSTTPTA